MKFLFVSDFECNPNSGAAGTLLSIGKALEKRSHTVDYLWKIQAKHQLSIHTLWLLFELPGKQTDQVRAKLAESDYDVVIVSQPYSFPIYEKLAKEYPNTLFVNRTHGWEARVLDAQTKYGWTAKRTFLKKIWNDYRTAKVNQFCKRTIESCHGFIAPSTRCMNYVKERYQISSDKTGIIPYGLDEDYLHSNLDSRVESEDIRMLYVGNYLPIKGSGVMEDILPTIAKKKNISMTFVVQPSAVDEIERKYRRSFGVRLNVRKWMPRKQLKQLYRTHDVMLYPSLFEGYGKTVLEAMSMGLCVVGFDEGGLADVSTSGETALFCKTGDLKAFKKHLEFAMAHPDKISEIGKKAHQAIQGFTWEKTASETETFCIERLRLHLENQK